MKHYDVDRENLFRQMLTAGVKLKFHESSFPLSILVTSLRGCRLANKSRGNRACRTCRMRMLRGSSRGCHEDATRKTVTWNLSFTRQVPSPIVLVTLGIHQAPFTLEIFISKFAFEILLKFRNKNFQRERHRLLDNNDGDDNDKLLQ